MKINSLNNQTHFCGNQNTNASSTLTSTAINAATGAIVGAGIGGVGCLMPVSKKSVTNVLCDAITLYKKDEFPTASEIGKLTKQLKDTLSNNDTLNFIEQIKEMSDDEFTKQAKTIAQKLEIPETNIKEDIIKAAEKKLIGKNPKIANETVIKDITEKLTKAQGDMLENAKKFMLDNPKDELVQLSKKVAKQVRNSQLLKSTIKFGFMASMLLGVFQAISNSKSSKE